ncbi:hypothetical protein DXA74_01635 [Bacteroides sp. OF04-15BH]|nr:hypothetical protein DXA74_01635 [Bacteroides sp. OF04-15BH]
MCYHYTIAHYLFLDAKVLLFFVTANFWATFFQLFFQRSDIHDFFLQKNPKVEIFWREYIA